MLYTLQSPALTQDHPHPHNGVLQEMFEARKSVFVDLLKWNVPVLAGRFEVDQFDDPHATYLVVTDSRHRHLASTRLLPTTRPHLLDSFYRQLCHEEPPCQRDILEITRFCLDRRLYALERRQARDSLVHALVDHALANAITGYSAIAELGWFQQILAFGWRCRPLGTPRSLEGRTLVAMRIDIDADTPAQLIAAGIGKSGPAPAPLRHAA
jgi:acyl-homoserine lactone synthase